MTALMIILGLLVITAIGFAFFFVYKYAIREYHFDLLGIGFLSLIPPTLASIGFFIVGGDNYFKALQQVIIDSPLVQNIRNLRFFVEKLEGV